MRFSPARALLAGLACCTIAAGVCCGNVFMSQGSAGDTATDSLSGRTGYAAPVSINSGRGQLQVSRLDLEFDAAVAALRSTLFAGCENHLAVGEGLAFGLLRSGDSVTRILLTQSGGKCVAFKLEQSLEEFAGSLRRSGSSRIKELPAYPGSVPVFSAGNDDTDSAIEIVSANTDVASAWNFVDTGLRRAGWVTASKPGVGRSADIAGMGIYVRGREVCCILVRKSATSGTESLICTLLHQRKNRNGETENED
ncbi:MAG: hypothetical protein WCL44_07065 [bacterium]